jgi:predicted nuclease of predicted toxin-antitoxin system
VNKIVARFLIDENLPLKLVDLLAQYGYDSLHVKRLDIKSSDDPVILEFAKQNNYILITRDLDFSNTLLYPRGSCSGIVVVRYPDSFITKQILRAFEEFIKSIKEEEFANSLIIVEIKRYRIRH